MTSNPNTKSESVAFNLAHIVQHSADALKKLREDFDRDPTHVFEWGENYYGPAHRGKLAARILQLRTDILETGEVADEAEAMRDALSLEIDEIRARLLYNTDRSCSSSHFRNACAEEKRAVEAIILREFEAMLQHLS